MTALCEDLEQRDEVPLSDLAALEAALCSQTALALSTSRPVVRCRDCALAIERKRKGVNLCFACRQNYKRGQSRLRYRRLRGEEEA